MKKLNPVALIFASLISGAIITYFVLSFIPAAESKETTASSEKIGTREVGSIPVPCDDISMLRENKLALVKPLLLLNYDCESKALDPLKQSITRLIDTLKANGSLTRAGVYFKELNTLKWTGLNYNDIFYPGSMLKVPMMINILKAAETTPGLLERDFLFEKPVGLNVEEAPLFPLVLGKSYKVKELLLSMIADSNNDATFLLSAVNDKTLYLKLFSDLGLELPEEEDIFYRMSPIDYSKFFRVLYNATYLIHENSQYAMEILLRTKFNEGFTKYLPNHAKVAHKFGERFTESDLLQFHETGIVYSGGSSYLLVIMTEGKNHELLKEAVAQISKLCFDMHSKGFGQLTDPDDVKHIL